MVCPDTEMVQREFGFEEEEVLDTKPLKLPTWQGALRGGVGSALYGTTSPKLSGLVNVHCELTSAPVADVAEIYPITVPTLHLVFSAGAGVPS
jgi:hypothetical protein